MKTNSTMLIDNNTRTYGSSIDLIDIYANSILGSMDMKTMEQYVFDKLVEDFSQYTNQELINHIFEIHGEQWFQEHNITLK